MEKDDADMSEVFFSWDILRNRMGALDKVVEKGGLRMGSIVPSTDVFQRKTLCLWLQELPQDPGRKYTVPVGYFPRLVLCRIEKRVLLGSNRADFSGQAGC